MSTTLKWGLITGMVCVIFSLVTTTMGIQQSGNKLLGYSLILIQIVITFITIYMGIKETREQDLGGYLTLGQGFMTGFKIALISGLMSAIFTLIYTKFIDPNFIDTMKTAMEDQWDKAGMPEENRDVARKWAGYFMNSFVFSAMALFGALFWGLIQSLVAGAMLKKNPPPATMPPA